MPPQKRTRVRRGTLNRDLIVDAAIGVLDRDGVEGFTMRAVAAALGAQQMSIYNYVTGKDDLLKAASMHLHTSVKPPPSDSSSIEDFIGVYRELWVLLKSHPWLVHVAVPPDSKEFLQLVEPTYRVLFRLGLSAREAAVFVTAVSNLVVGCAAHYAAMQQSAAGEDERIAADHAAIAALPEKEYPALQRLVEELPAVTPEAALEHGFAALVSSLGLPRERNP
ncbi:TetR/AcrR family transcriptional regulator [Sinosporangium siamense]|nr:TetR/AcrR family transcriptional regulator C-terminal domain-containing protein [Sinosporangium siamense]